MQKFILDWSEKDEYNECNKCALKGAVLMFWEKFRNRNRINQSRTIAEKLKDSHVKYASEKIDEVDTIIGREGHLNIVEEKDFELVFGVESAFRFVIDEMSIWEFMSLDGAVVSGVDKNTGNERTVTVYYDRRLT